MFTLGRVQTQGIDKTVNDQLTVTSRELSTELLDIYTSVKGYDRILENNSSSLIRQVEVTLPQVVGSRNYKMSVEEPQDILLAIVQFYVDGIAINTTSSRPTARLIAESQDILVENKLYNIDIGLQGFTKGGATKIRGYKYNYNGDERDKIIIGDDTIIIGIQNFSVNSSTGAECPNNKKITINGHNMYTSGSIPSTLNMKATILETSESNTTTSSNPFTIHICTSIADQREGTALIEVWDSNNNRGTIRKKFLG